MSIKETEKQSQPFTFQEELFLIQSLDAEIAVREKNVAREMGQLQEIQNQKSEKLKTIQEKIKTGKASTGNKIEDFVIVYHLGNKEVEKQYHSLADNLKEHCGELILIKKIQKALAPSMGSLKRFAWFEDCQLGVISQKAPEFNFKSGEISFTNGFLAFETDFLTHKIKPRKVMNSKYHPNAKSYLFWLDHKYLNQPIEKFESMAKGIKDFQLEIFIGNKTVKEKLQNYSSNLEQISCLPQNIANHLKSPKT